jgi:sugar/nucleoside kinase (ribokinase family)
MTIIEDIGLKWSNTIAKAFLAWAESEAVSRELKISQFDPEPQLTLAFYEAGEAQLAVLGKLLGTTMKFDLRSKEAEAWIKKYSGEQIKYISKTNQLAIRQIKLRAFQEGLSIGEQKQLIKQFVGLLPQHVIAVGNYQDGLMSTGMDKASAEKLAAEYRAKLLNYRAKNIAVTEGMMATNEGVRKTNENAVKRGVVDPNEYEQEWIATGLKNVCDKCRSANGSRAPIGGTFPNGSRGPPIHPSDHCNVVLVRK